MSEPETIVCSECEEPTHDDESTTFVDWLDQSKRRVVCFECCPPDA